ncbi:hypothetical protein [Gordonia neofelifaecis]|uniref:Helix-turn-helix domain-containing protein n=1 Tax=Gordonia neofelifaecis NRRL B-59395 TaxID=644548 RepID=F1YJF1_9ACTN|nr:hypothetical protein [Gordonia neofelifaecis]EGD55184.1 hypothetical protein SCNU_09939 [Gordonia neofelifaecis NRRL B-59395]
MTGQPCWIGIPAAADMLNENPSVFRRRISAGQIDMIRVSTRIIRVRISDVEALKGTPPPEPRPKSSPRDIVGYGGAHTRVRAAKGKASEYPCVDCGHPAEDWSYDHQDPDERYGSDGARGRTPMPYSMDPEHYAPRCKKCHYAFDGDRLAGHRSGRRKVSA